MKTLSLLDKVRKELAAARVKAAQKEKTADLAWQTARAAKLKVKQAKKLAKLAKKSARKADDASEFSLEISERLQSKLEKLEKRARKEQPNGKMLSPRITDLRKKTVAPHSKSKSSARLKITSLPVKAMQAAAPELIDDGSDAFQQLPPIRPS